MASIACLPPPGTMLMLSHLVISPSHRAVPSCVPCLLAARLAFPYLISSHLIGHRLACLLPALRHGWAGREAGSVQCPACLVVALRSVPMSIAGSCRFLCGAPSVCLRVGSSWLRGDGVLILSVWGVLRCPCLPPVGSSRFSPRSSSRRSGRFFVSRPVLRHDGRGGERMR